MTEFMVQEAHARGVALPNDVVLRTVRPGQQKVIILNTDQCTVAVAVTVVDRFIDPKGTLQEFRKYQITYSVDDHRFNPFSGPDNCEMLKQVEFGCTVPLVISDGDQTTAIAFLAESIPDGDGQRLKAGECAVLGGEMCIHHFFFPDIAEYVREDEWRQIRGRFAKQGVQPSDLKMMIIPKAEHDRQQTPLPPYRSGGTIWDVAPLTKKK